MLNKYRLNRKLTNFCKNFGIKKVKCTNEFSYLPDKSLVTYTLYMTDTDLEFIDLVNSKYNITIQSMYFIFCLLHEIGHHMTMDEMTTEDLETDLLLRKMIPFFEKQGQAYINFTAERLATEWAIKFIRENFDFCFSFQNECLELMG